MALLTSDLVQRLRPLSKVAFGQELRLPLVLAIGREPDAVFRQKDLPSWVGIAAFSGIARPFDSLLAIGAIERLPDNGESLILIRRRDTGLWAYGEELLNAFLTRPSPDTLF